MGYALRFIVSATNQCISMEVLYDQKRWASEIIEDLVQNVADNLRLLITATGEREALSVLLSEIRPLRMSGEDLEDLAKEVRRLQD